MTQPLISVIVPCYNQAQYLDECLESVLDQTYEYWECIIVNDGSPDHTEEVAKAWLVKDKRFRYIYQENSGVSAARNNGIENSNGEWILPLDGDDKIAKTYLEKANALIEQGYELIYSDALYFGEKVGDWILEDYSFSKLLYHNIIVCSAIFKKNNIRFDENMTFGFEDWEFWLNYVSSVKDIKVFKIPSFEFFYRIKKESRNKKVNNDKDQYLEMKNYVYFKHRNKYALNFGDYFSIYRENKLLKDQIHNTNMKLESKRYKLIDKILSLFGK